MTFAWRHGRVSFAARSLAASMQIPALVLSGDLGTGLRNATRMWDRWQQAGSAPTAWVIPAVALAALAHHLRGDHQARATWGTRVLLAAGTAGPSQERTLAALVFLGHSSGHLHRAQDRGGHAGLPRVR